MAYLTFASSGQATLLLSEKNITNKFIWSSGLLVLGLWMVSAFVTSSILLML